MSYINESIKTDMCSVVGAELLLRKALAFSA